jgi:UDP-N-acetylglucosamine diphosphorylase/glucosamine-1-phosphate N-acetyltransferase
VAAFLGGIREKDNQARQSSTSGLIIIANSYDIFMQNDAAIRADFNILTRGRTSAAISSTNQLISPANIFAEEGAKIECSVLNASAGPIYIAKDAEVMEGCLVRGPFSLGEHSSLKMGAKIYSATTIGPHCKVGGEVNNSVIFGYSNKAHDGFLGNSVVGEWCNFGADSNNSNLKNNYAEVKLWNYASSRFENTGLQYCGLMMGDHSKCGINTMFNTGTVVGVGANIFGAGFPRNFIPSFAWGGAAGFETFQLKKFYELADTVMKRRNLTLQDADREILARIFNDSARHRFWEKQGEPA